jgi:two-component system chemotaxis response regulator CheY
MSKSVLVVDDSSFMRKRIIGELTQRGYQIVGEARDGNEAIELYDNLKPDLVTMDITMRGKDGLSASKEILQKYPEAKIVVLTMLKENDYQTLAKNLGVKGFLLKDQLHKLGELLD